jgi:hypothetical protein
MMNETEKKMTNMTLNIGFPKIVLAGDYHEFADHGAMGTLIKSLHSRLKLDEVGFVGSQYLGVIYTGRKPSRAQVLELIKARFAKLGDMYIEVNGKEYDSKKDKWVTAY